MSKTLILNNTNSTFYSLGTYLREHEFFCKVLCPGAAEKIKAGSFPNVKEMIDKTRSMGIEILVCEASKQMLGWEKVDLIPGVKIVGAATLNEFVLESTKTMWF